MEIIRMFKLNYILLLSTIVSLNLFAKSLDSKLEDLTVPDDKVTNLLSEDQLTSVTGRYSSLNKRHEFSIQGANNFTSDSHVHNRQAGLVYRFHVNADWSFGASYMEYENELSSAGERLFDEGKILPDSDFAYKSADVFVNYNTVYGKLRLTKRQIVYFDHYISLGYGHIDLDSGETQLYTADTGFAFWIGKHASLRVGSRNEFFRQKKLTGDTNAHASMGYISFGYLL